MQTNVYLSRHRCSFLAWEGQSSLENNEDTYRHFCIAVSSQHSRSFGQRQHPFMVPWLLFPINVFFYIESWLSLPPFVVDYFDFGWSCIYKRLFCYENIHQASCLPFKAFWPALWDSPVISVIIFFIQPSGIFCSQFGILVVFLAQFKRVLTKLDVSNLNINVLWDLR